MKKIISLLFVICCMLGLASCGGAGDKVKIIDIKLTEEQYAYVVKQGNTELAEDFNKFLDEIKENGTFDEIVAKYFEGTGTKKGISYVTDANATNDDKTFVVATNCPFEPFEYVGTDGLMYGIDIEIAQAYAEAKGLALVVKNIDFDAIFTNVDSGYADMGMAGITVNAEREALYDFTNAYYEASQKLVVAADNTDFDNCKTAADVEAVLAGLTGKKVGYQIGTTGNWYVAGDADWGFDGFANIEAKGYKTAQLAIQDIANGQIYGVVVDEAPAAAMVKATNNA
ncbi:MAG: transporter substrate-binding domain-containing protein [Bacilli bacterium]|nr:transporter substrate-binding domain-containing protein [Bacilli bacterium]